MPTIKINQQKISPEAVQSIIGLCPFSAITFDGEKLSITSGCRMCKLCIKKGDGVFEYVDDEQKSVNKDEWKGIAVYADFCGSKLHNVALELLGKAKELAKTINQPVYALLIGHNLSEAAQTLLSYGADAVYVCDDIRLKDFIIEPYANVFEKFINIVKPSSILVGATSIGRSLAPRVAARFRTGLTADCTVLEIKDNTDLVQIRPAFGGNIMAQIITPRTRPQMCTVRYKIFSAPEKCKNPTGRIVPIETDDTMLACSTKILSIDEMPKEQDLSEAEIIVAVGRGVKNKEDLALAEEFANSIGARLACTRPMVESGLFHAKNQIGLSGRTVKAKLIVTIGVSGSVQFAAGMRNSDCIIAINKDKHAPIFDIAHYGFVGSFQDVLPKVLSMIKGESTCEL